MARVRTPAPTQQGVFTTLLKARLRPSEPARVVVVGTPGPVLPFLLIAAPGAQPGASPAPTDATLAPSPIDHRSLARRRCPAPRLPCCPCSAARRPAPHVHDPSHGPPLPLPCPLPPRPGQPCHEGAAALRRLPSTRPLRGARPTPARKPKPRDRSPVPPVEYVPGGPQPIF